MNNNGDFVKNEITGSGDVCAQLGIPSLTHPYDAANWPITKAPIFYFEGEFIIDTTVNLLKSVYLLNELVIPLLEHFNK